MTRPTIEQIADARKEVARELEFAPECVRVLYAATEPPTDEEIDSFVKKFYDMFLHTEAYRLGRFVVRHFFGPVKP